MNCLAGKNVEQYFDVENQSRYNHEYQHRYTVVKYHYYCFW